MIRNFVRNKRLISSILAILVGLLFGLGVLAAANPSQALDGFRSILFGAATHGTKGFGQVIYYATPIILTGLSVGVAFQTGLFNIGAPGQFIVGAFVAVWVGIHGKSLGSSLWIVALLSSLFAGAVWALVPSLLNAYFRVNEVISSIMMNYIGMYFVNYMVRSSSTLYDPLKNRTMPVSANAQIPKWGLDSLFPGSNANGGILIAIATVIIIAILLKKTVFGYELKAVGLNKMAGRYAGIQEKKCLVWSMVLAGALAGLGGGLLYLAGSGKHIEVVDVLAYEGFTGISVALLGLSNPIGIMLAGFFIAYITAGGFYLQLLDYSTEIIDIILSVIIYFSAFSFILLHYLERFRKKQKGAQP